MNLLPTVRIGKSLLVERDALAGFLARLAEADDPARALAAMRAQGKPPVVRRKLRELVQRDVAVGESALPTNVRLAPGELTVSFETVEELAVALWRLAQLLNEDLDGFAERYEPAIEAHDLQKVDLAEQEDAAFLRKWLEEHK
jgi:hypothetical protein